jgi:hypothetical protein
MGKPPDSLFLSFLFYFIIWYFLANACISPFNTQAMHIKSLSQQHCYDFPKKNLIPWLDSNPGLLVSEADAMSTAPLRHIYWTQIQAHFFCLFWHLFRWKVIGNLVAKNIIAMYKILNAFHTPWRDSNRAVHTLVSNFVGARGQCYNHYFWAILTTRKSEKYYFLSRPVTGFLLHKLLNYNLIF